MEKKPEVPGKAARARPPQSIVIEVKRIALPKPFMPSMFCSLAIAAMIEPAAMKSSALKKAWVIRWNMPAL